MSELKAINAYRLTTNTEDSDVFIHNDEFGCGGDLVECYLKSEADKVIADLEESHKMEVEQLLIVIAELKADYKEACDRLQTANLIKDEQLAAARHHKYKRCLAMASYWGLVSVLVHGETQLKCMRRELKWHKLAEKFKEDK